MANYTAEAPSSPGVGGARISPVNIDNASYSVLKRYNDIIKSKEDKREYRGLELTNRLKVLLVSDPSTDKSAAALAVNVGYLCDPDELPGLAHFCEHMLFLGTKKYPQENEYTKFLSEHGGSSNAYTTTDYTTFYFDVLPDHLAEVLEIFSQFFICPLFTESATGRELSAVNSEHENNLFNDTWRLNQFNKSTAVPGHPYTKFGTGNKETLDVIPKQKGIDVRKELLKFHRTWYSANIMTFIVIGKESLDELEEMVVPLFSEIEDRDVPPPAWPQHPYPASQCRKRAYCLPIKDLRSLSIDFPIPDYLKHYKSGPSHYLSHLLGHEGPGSLLAALKDRGWVDSLEGGTRTGARGFGFFGVHVDLTEDGLDHIDAIVNMVFQYIAMLREVGPQRWVWDEQRETMATDFTYKDVQDPRSFVVTYVQLLQEFPMEETLSAYYLLSEWKPDLIEELLSRLVPDNVRIGIVAKRFADKCTEVEPWYGTKYLQEDIEESKLKEWEEAAAGPELHLPPPNEFLPDRLELETSHDPTADSIAPIILKDTPLMRLWFKRDNEFKLPKAYLAIDFFSPLSYADPESCTLLSLWALLIKDGLQEYAYAADLAGLKWYISIDKQGINITIDGYDDKQHVLLDKIIDHVVNFSADPKRFHIMKENHIRALNNFEAEKPHQHALYQQTLCLTDVVWTRSDLLAAAKETTPEKLEAFVRRLLRKLHVEALMMGNLTRERALAMAHHIEDKLPKDATPLLAQEFMLSREVELGKGSWFLRRAENSVHKSSCTLLYYACGPRAARANVTLELVAHTLTEPAFNVLRTKEQLGYIVMTGLRRSNGAQGLRVVVQGDRHPDYLEERIEAFLQSFQGELEGMSEEQFLKHRSTLAAQRLQRPKRMYTKAARMWAEIVTRMYNFDRARVEVEQLNTITKEEFLEYYKKHISAESGARQKLSVHVVSTAQGGAGAEDKEDAEEEEKESQQDQPQAVKIEDLVEFKSRRRLYPLPAPFASVPRKGKHCKL